MNYSEAAKEKIDIENLPQTSYDRCSQKVKELLEKEFVIDVHSHLFDIRCINKTYFLLRVIKDFFGIKSTRFKGDNMIFYSEDELYQKISEFDTNWEEDLLQEFESTNPSFGAMESSRKGLVDYWQARKFLFFKRMSSVYKHYIKNFSLADNFKNVPQKNVLVTALMMDLEIGWDTRIRKSFYQQIKELKTLSKNYPVLPFLFCDPRRADIKNKRKNLYDLFNFAFCESHYFFGVKIYPALGYDPSDHRLWPIYEICESYKIPVLTHCGGETISTDETTSLTVFEGDNKVTLSANNRKQMAKKLNDPNRWKLVLEKFPNLKLNFAHFGGYDTWEEVTPLTDAEDPQHRKETIIDFINNYPNVYADFSFNLVEDHLTKNLKTVLYNSESVRNKTMFGTDYWVVNPQGNLAKEQKEFLDIMTKGIEDLELPKKLCLDNPKNYLFGELTL